MNKPSLLKSSNTLLLIIDMQEKLLKPIINNKQIIWNINRLLKASQILNVRRFHTEQNPLKLGETLKVISERIETAPAKKMEFSCCNSKEVLEQISIHEITSVLLCGIETHVCIQQTATELLGKGFSINLVVDALGSRQELDHITGIRRMESLGAKIISTESAIFELCKTSDRKEFRQISNLIKEDNCE